VRKVRSTWRLIEDRIHYVCFFGTAKGGKAFRDITMPFVGYPQKLQWDGKHMALNAGGTIYQMQVSGSRGKIVGTTGLRGDTEGGGQHGLPATRYWGRTAVKARAAWAAETRSSATST
jgi:hypothetical protein